LFTLRVVLHVTIVHLLPVYVVPDYCFHVDSLFVLTLYTRLRSRYYRYYVVCFAVTTRCSLVWLHPLPVTPLHLPHVCHAYDYTFTLFCYVVRVLFTLLPLRLPLRCCCCFALVRSFPLLRVCTFICSVTLRCSVVAFTLLFCCCCCSIVIVVVVVHCCCWLPVTLLLFVIVDDLLLLLLLLYRCDDVYTTLPDLRTLCVELLPRLLFVVALPLHLFVYHVVVVATFVTFVAFHVCIPVTLLFALRSLLLITLLLIYVYVTLPLFYRCPVVVFWLHVPHVYGWLRYHRRLLLRSRCSGYRFAVTWFYHLSRFTRAFTLRAVSGCHGCYVVLYTRYVLGPHFCWIRGYVYIRAVYGYGYTLPFRLHYHVAVGFTIAFALWITRCTRAHAHTQLRYAGYRGFVLLRSGCLLPGLVLHLPLRLLVWLILCFVYVYRYVVVRLRCSAHCSYALRLHVAFRLLRLRLRYVALPLRCCTLFYVLGLRLPLHYTLRVCGYRAGSLPVAIRYGLVPVLGSAVCVPGYTLDYIPFVELIHLHGYVYVVRFCGLRLRFVVVALRLLLGSLPRYHLVPVVGLRLRFVWFACGCRFTLPHGSAVTLLVPPLGFARLPHVVYHVTVRTLHVVVAFVVYRLLRFITCCSTFAPVHTFVVVPRSLLRLLRLLPGRWLCGCCLLHLRGCCLHVIVVRLPDLLRYHCHVRHTLPLVLRRHVLRIYCGYVTTGCRVTYFVSTDFHGLPFTRGWFTVTFRGLRLRVYVVLVRSGYVVVTAVGYVVTVGLLRSGLRYVCVYVPFTRTCGLRFGYAPRCVVTCTLHALPHVWSWFRVTLLPFTVYAVYLRTVAVYCGCRTVVAVLHLRFVVRYCLHAYLRLRFDLRLHFAVLRLRLRCYRSLFVTFWIRSLHV